MSGASLGSNEQDYWSYDINILGDIHILDEDGCSSSEVEEYLEEDEYQYLNYDIGILSLREQSIIGTYDMYQNHRESNYEYGRLTCIYRSLYPVYTDIEELTLHRYLRDMRLIVGRRITNIEGNT